MMTQVWENQKVRWFLVLECLIYIAFMWLDSFSSGVQVSAYLKLLSIGICLVFLLISVYQSPENKDSRLMALIMGFTFFSDIFLLLTRQFIIGLILFIVVQSLYAIRIHQKLKLTQMLTLALALIFSLIFFVQWMHQPFGFGLLLALGIFYALLFAWNLIWLTYKLSNDASKTDYSLRLFMLGMVLYALCDINVAIYNFPSFFTSSPLMTRIYGFSPLGMWLFYLPGQVALTLSVRRKRDGLDG